MSASADLPTPGDAVAEAAPPPGEGVASDESRYEALLAQDPDDRRALEQLSLMRIQRGAFAEAAHLLERMIARDPNSSGVHNNLGIALNGLNRPAEAMAHFERAIELEPNRPEAHYNLGRAQQVLGRRAQARESLERALALKPDYAEAHNTLGVLLAPDDPERAIACFRRAAAARPGFADAHNNMGIALQELGRHEEAVASYRQALAIKPDHADAYNNLGLSLRDLNRHAEAIAAFEIAQGIKADKVDAHVNEALVRLALGDYATGWKKYEWRLLTANFSKGKKRPSQPLWLGQWDIAGKTLLLHGEQGLGDTIQFARYVPRVAALGARVILVVQRPLTALMATLAGASVVRGQGDPVPPFDGYCPLPSMPLAFKTTVETIPADMPYLSASADRLAKWRPIVDVLPRPRVGLVWTRGGGPQDRRSMPLHDLLPLLELPDIQFVALQKELPDSEAALFKSTGVPSFLGERLGDLADTAAIIAMLDLVITIDTSIVHVAGALAKPTWVLLPFSADWRWLRQRSDSPWYPSARLFRQPALGDWGGVVAQVVDALRQFR